MDERMVSGPIAWHVISAELHTGMLTLAFVSVLIYLAGGWVKGNGLWRALVRLAEPTAYLAGLGGTLALTASAVTGMTYTWPAEVLLTSTVVLNKILFSAFALTFWTLFLLVRSIYHTGVWEVPRLKWLYVSLATAGFSALMMAGSIGGHLGGKRSLLDGLKHRLGINTHELFTLPAPLAYALIALGAALVLAALGRRWLRRGPVA